MADTRAVWHEKFKKKVRSRRTASIFKAINVAQASEAGEDAGDAICNKSCAQLTLFISSNRFFRARRTGISKIPPEKVNKLIIPSMGD